jgi:hypothetical protein
LVAELVAYQAEKLPSGLMRYGAPAGQHDDTVMALALAWTQVGGRHRPVYPILDQVLVVPDLTIPMDWPRAYGLEMRCLTMAVIWGARDPQTDVVYLFGEYCAEAEPAVHASAIRRRGSWIPGLVDPCARGRDRTDGYRLIEKYKELGLRLEGCGNPIESGIMGVHERMSSGRLKVCASLSKYLAERRLYRRDERDQIVQERDSLQDAVRCLINNLSRMRTRPVPTPSYSPAGPYFGGQGWMR